MKNPFTMIPVGWEITITISIIFLLLLAIMGSIIHNKLHPDKTISIQLSATLASITLLPILLLAFIGTSLYTANAKGMSYIKWHNLTLEQIDKTAKKTPTISQIPVNRPDLCNIPCAIIILYKFGCPDCESIYPSLRAKLLQNKLLQNKLLQNKLLQNHAQVYFVPSGSAFGKKLIKDGHIRQVPTGVYIRRTPLANGAKQNNFILFTIDKNGKTVLNQQALDNLFLLQKQER